MRNDGERLADILEAIERIKKYTEIEKHVFENDELIQTWVLHHLQIIGEACRSMTVKFRAEYPEIPWSQIIGMRNILVHQYFEIDTDIVWEAITRDLPLLEHEIRKSKPE